MASTPHSRSRTIPAADFTALSTLECVLGVGVICAGIWLVIAYTILGL